MNTSNCIRITYEYCGSSERGTRIMDFQTLSRFAGYNIGARNTNHLVLKDPSVCPMHIQIDIINSSEFLLTHLETGRANSVRVGNKWIPVGSSVKIHDGAHITVGSVKITFETNLKI